MPPAAPCLAQVSVGRQLPHEETSVSVRSEIEENGTINCIIENIVGIKN